MRDWIIKASYKKLLRKNRFGSMEDPIFQGEIGEFFIDQMAIKKSELSAEAQVRISKEIGWG